MEELFSPVIIALAKADMRFRTGAYLALTGWLAGWLSAHAQTDRGSGKEILKQ